MGRIDRKRARRAAQRDIRIGLIAGIGLAALQLIALVNFVARSPAPISWLGAYALARCLITVGLVFNVYRRHDWAAAMLLGFLVLDVVASSTLVGRIVSPVSLLSLVLGYGAYRGLRGAEALASEPVEARAPAV